MLKYGHYVNAVCPSIRPPFYRRKTYMAYLKSTSNGLKNGLFSYPSHNNYPTHRNFVPRDVHHFHWELF